MKKRALFTVLTASLMCATAAVVFAACGDEEAKTYLVTYAKSTLNETGAVPTDTAKYEEGAEVTVKGKGDLALTDYTFSGWVYDGKTYTEGAKITMPAKDITLTAKWIPVPATKYTVTFAANVDDDGLTLPDALEVVAGTAVDLADYPVTLNGYRFVSWSDGTNTYAADDTYTVTGNVTLTATLREEAFSETVTLTATTYDSNEAKYTVGDVDSMWGTWYKEITVTGTEGAYYTLVFEGENNPFAAYLSQDDYDSMEGLIESDTAKMFKMPAGGSQKIYIVGGMGNEMPDHEKDEGSGVSISGVISVLKGGSGTVTFLLDENYPGRPNENLVTTLEVEGGKKVSELPAAPEYEEGYVFEGWYYVTMDTSMGRPRPVYVPFTTDTIIESDLTVYAKWTVATYNNGLEENEEIVAVTLGEKNQDNIYTVTLGGADTFTKTKANAFLYGWTVTLDYVEDTYFPGEQIEVPVGSIVTIAAIWQDYNKTFEGVALGTWGQALPNSFTLNNNEKITVTLNGYTTAPETEATHGGLVMQILDPADSTYFYFFQANQGTAKIVNDNWTINGSYPWENSGMTITVKDGAGADAAISAWDAIRKTGKTVMEVSLKDGTFTSVTSVYASEATTPSYVITRTLATTLTKFTLNFAFADGYANSNGANISYAVFSHNQAPTTANPVEIGTSDKSLAWGGESRQLWTTLINKGEKLTLSGTMTSKAVNNWDGVLLSIYSGAAATGKFRVDNYIVGEAALKTAEGWTIVGNPYVKTPSTEGADDGAKFWNGAKAIFANCTLTVTVDWTNESQIVATVKCENADNVFTQTYTITAADAKTLAGSYTIGLDGESSYTVINSVTRTVHTAD